MTREFDARTDRYGRFYDEFEVGDIYRHWPGKTITESEDHLYCMLTMAGSFMLILTMPIWRCHKAKTLLSVPISMHY
jgi:hypothetical protein